MVWVLVIVVFLAFISTARFATPSQKAETPARVQRVVFMCWLVLGAIAIWMAWDAAGWGCGLVAGGVTAVVLVDSRRKGRAKGG